MILVMGLNIVRLLKKLLLQLLFLLCNVIPNASFLGGGGGGCICVVVIKACRHHKQ